MKNKTILSLIIAAAVFVISSFESQALTHSVVKGDSMWKIAVKYEIGLSEIISANPQIKNPALIYPGDTLTIPTLDETVLSFEKEVIRLVNEKRVANGLAALKTNWELSRVARYKSWDMRDNKYFSHTSPTYGSPFTMIKNFGISYMSAAENIAVGYTTPAAVVEGWWNSAGHKANILGARYTETGVGYVAQGKYWTQMFIGY